MKITAKKYAEALLHSTKNKSEEDVKKAVKNLLSILVENKDLKIADDIVKQFLELWNKEHSISEVEVTTARIMDKASRKDIEKFIIEKFKVKSVEINEKVDKNIVI